jgi:hypothetical protein
MVTLWRPGVGLDETGTALVAVEGAEAPAKLVYPGDLHVTKMAPEGKAAPSGDCYAFEWTGPVCTAVFGGGPKPRAPV